MVLSVAIGARHIDDDSRWLVGFGAGFVLDGSLGVKELVGDVSHNGSTARGDAAFGDKHQELGEKLVDVNGGLELEGRTEEFGGEVLRVTRRLLLGGPGVAQAEMVRAKTKMGLRAGKPTTLAVGITIVAAIGKVASYDPDRVGVDGGARILCSYVHGFFLLGGTPPGISYEYQNKRVTKFAFRNCMKIQGIDKT